MPALATRMDRAERAAMEREVLLAREQERRRKSYPLAYVDLWHRDPPRTSQREALRPLADPECSILAILGGNRSGKSECLADILVAMAAGRDAFVDGPEGRVYWVARWLARNGLPEDLVPLGPGRVWVGSPSYGAACEQIRPKLAGLVPAGSRMVSWDDPRSQGEIRLPNGGVIVSKAYKQFDQDPQSWEGANVRFIGLDEQPNCRENLAAALSRLVDQRGKIAVALTELRGTADWFHLDLVAKPPPHVRLRYIYPRDNPHIPQDALERMLAAVPPWQRASREFGTATNPVGAIYGLVHGTHVVDRFPIPLPWVRWQGIDWGSRAPHVVWAAEVPVRHEAAGRVFLPGDLVAYRELAPRRTTMEPGISARRLIEQARALENGEESLQLGTTYRVADSEDPGAIAEAAEQGWWISAAAKGPGSVVKGIELVDALLQTVEPVTLQERRPRLYFMSSCPQLIEEMGGMRWEDVREGQDARPDPSCPDHGPDALRYIIQHRQEMGFR